MPSIVVSGRINSFPPYLTEALKSLSEQSAGPRYLLPADDGSTISLTETQLIAHIIKDLISDRDRIMGFAVAARDLRNFLERHKIDP